MTPLMAPTYMTPGIPKFRLPDFSVTIWKGRYERYYSADGAVYVDIWNNTIRTAFLKDEFSDSVQKSMEVIQKYGR